MVFWCGMTRACAAACQHAHTLIANPSKPDACTSPPWPTETQSLSVSTPPAMVARMHTSLRVVKRSRRNTQDSAKVKSEAVEERMVLEVTEVRASEALNAYWAASHSGVACRGWR